MGQFAAVLAVLALLCGLGGTAAAACELVERVGAQIAGVGFVVELEFLYGREKLDGQNVLSLVSY